MRDGRIAYVDFGNVAELSQANKEVLIDAVVHAGGWVQRVVLWCCVCGGGVGCVGGGGG